jgi:hypothetical protein
MKSRKDSMSKQVLQESTTLTSASLQLITVKTKVTISSNRSNFTAFSFTGTYAGLFICKGEYKSINFFSRFPWISPFAAFRMKSILTRYGIDSSTLQPIQQFPRRFCDNTSLYVDQVNKTLVPMFG